MRSNNGYVFRSDSGWKAESDGFYQFDYTLDLKIDSERSMSPAPYEFHARAGQGRLERARDSRLPGRRSLYVLVHPEPIPTCRPELQRLSLPEWQQIFAGAYQFESTRWTCISRRSSSTRTCTSTTWSSGGDRHGARRRGPVAQDARLRPAHAVDDPDSRPDVLPICCDSRMARSGARWTARSTSRSRSSGCGWSRVDVNPATNAAGKSVFVTAARGSLILPPDGSWSVVKQHTDTGDVKPVPPQETVPLIKPNAQLELPDRPSRRTSHVPTSRFPLRGRAIDGHAEAALRRPAVHARRCQAQERADLLRGRLQAAQLEGSRFPTSPMRWD